MVLRGKMDVSEGKESRIEEKEGRGRWEGKEEEGGGNWAGRKKK